MARKTWMRGSGRALERAAAARSTSAVTARARPAMIGRRTSAAIGADRREVAVRGDREPGLDDVHAERVELARQAQLLAAVMLKPGACSPSRSDVSKTRTRMGSPMRSQCRADGCY